MLKYIEQQADNNSAAFAAPAASTTRIEKVTRRRFLQVAGGAGGLVLAAQFLPGTAHAFEPYKTGAEGMPNKTVINPSVFVSIDPDGTVTLTAHRSEMGTGSRTSVPMVLADEMDADWSRVQIRQAEGDEPKYGNQDTDGSRSLRHYVQPMRQMGASVRHMLEAAAAQRWGVEASMVRAMSHEVHRLDDAGKPTGEKLGYGDLAADAMKLELPAFDALRFKTDDQFRYMGTGEVPMVDLHDITTGKARYGADYTVDGMKYAAVARPPVAPCHRPSLRPWAELPLLRAIPGPPSRAVMRCKLNGARARMTSTTATRSCSRCMSRPSNRAR